MESNDKLKEIDIKNRRSYYLNEVFYLDNILKDQRSYENISVHNILQKSLKLVSAIFHQFFIFNQMIALQKL